MAEVRPLKLPVAAPETPLSRTTAQYPLLAKYTGRLAFRQSPADQTGRKSEFYQRGEQDSFSPNHPAIQVFGDTKTRDIAGDIVSHYLARGVDPTLTRTYNQFRESMTPAQQARLRDQYVWAQQHENETRPFDQWKHSVGEPAYFRGYAFGQWPSPHVFYTPQQIAMFDQMNAYLAGHVTAALARGGHA